MFLQCASTPFPTLATVPGPETSVARMYVPSRKIIVRIRSLVILQSTTPWCLSDSEGTWKVPRWFRYIGKRLFDLYSYASDVLLLCLNDMTCLAIFTGSWLGFVTLYRISAHIRKTVKLRPTCRRECYHCQARRRTFTSMLTHTR